MTAPGTPAFVFILVVAGIFGLVIGSFLNVVIARVPERISLNRESRCPRCGAPVRPWQNVPVISWLLLRGECASCAEPISPRYPLIEAATALAFVLVTAGVFSMGEMTSSRVAALIVLLWFAAASITLTMIDIDTRRLPTPIIAVSGGAIAVLLVLATVLGGPLDALIRAGIGGAALWGFYALLRLIRPGGMGAGDVRLAALVGIVLGYSGWDVLIVGAFAAFVFGGVFGIVLLIARRAQRSTAVPFGPWMLAGAWFGLLAGAPLAQAYLALIA